MAQESNILIEVSDDGVNFTSLTTLAANVTAYQHTGLTAGVQKYYRITAKGNGSTTLDSATATATATTSLPSNTAPTISSVSTTGTKQVGFELTATYTYADADGDTQGSTSFVWFRADDANGLNKAAIAGATASKYLLANADSGKFISVSVTATDSRGATGTGESQPTQVYQEPALVETAVFNKTTYNDAGAGYMKKTGGGNDWQNIGATASKAFTGDGWVQWRAFDTAKTGNAGGLANGEPITYSSTNVDYQAYNANTDTMVARESGTTANSNLGSAIANYFRVRRRGTVITYETSPAEAGPWVVVHTSAVASPSTDLLYFKAGAYDIGAGVTDAKICANAFTDTVYA
jgi:hypothetical protein